MSPKVRLDLTVNESTKRSLQQFALEQGVSMSEMVDQLIVEHLMREAEEDAAVETSDASVSLFDMLKIQELQQRLVNAIAKGLVWPLDKMGKEGVPHTADNIFYMPTGSENYGVIVDSIEPYGIDTFGGNEYQSVLETVDAYIEWDADNEDRLELNSLYIVPKGARVSDAEGYRWEFPTQWPEGKPEPWVE